MASCFVPDHPAVMAALEHLTELDKQFKEERVSFSPAASLHFREITAAITELEASRRAIHEQLEVETIENGKMRHKLHNIREDISQEILRDVAAARESNADELEQLHRELNTILQLREDAAARQETLSKENAALHTLREEVKAEHEKDVAALSDQITQNACMEIQLKQTLDTVEDLKTSIATLQQKKMTMQQNMIRERDIFNVTKGNLLKDADQTVNTIQQQKQHNDINSVALDKINMQIVTTNARITELTNRTAQLQQSIEQLAASHVQCEAQLTESMQQHQKTLQQIENAEKELCEQRQCLSTTIQHLQEDIIMADRDMEEAGAMSTVYQKSLAEASAYYTSQRKQEDDVRAAHLCVSQQLARSKGELEACFTSIDMHHIDIGKMEDEIRQLLDVDSVNEGLFEKNLGELQSQLDTEKKNRSQFEEEKAKLLGLLEEAKDTHKECVAKALSAISDTRRQYQELLQEEAALKEHKAMDCEIDTLTRQVTQSELDYNQMIKTYHQEIEEYSEELACIVRLTQDKEREVQEQERLLEEVEAQFDKDQAMHERLKNATSELESRRNHLVKYIQALEEKTSFQVQSKEKMKADLDTARACETDLLASQAAELRSVEMKIYDSGLKLEQVGMENSRLHLCVVQMETDAANAREDKKRFWREIDWLRKEVSSLNERLVQAWKQDLQVTEQCRSSDDVLLESMGFLLAQLQNRKLRLGNVNKHLHERLLYISKVLDKV